MATPKKFTKSPLSNTDKEMNKENLDEIRNKKSFDDDDDFDLPLDDLDAFDDFDSDDDDDDSY